MLTNDDVIVEGESGQDLYQVEDYDRKIIVDQRTELVAKTILQNINPLEKTIVFCENQNHALTMRDMINKYKAVKDPQYCVRVTSDEGKVGRELLEKFQDNDKDIPTIITSSQMLTTGVDARNVRNVVLDRTIDSMVEFKQIVGRGTRVFDGKDYFTIVDFRGATNNFYDEEWDGEPEAPKPGGTREPIPPPYTPDQPEGGDEPEPEPGEPRPRLRVRLGNHRELKVIDIETRYIDENGKPLTIQEFVERLIQQLPGLFKSVDELREIWSDPDLREKLLAKLVQAGFDREQLSTLRLMFEADDCDMFDLLAFLAFEQPMATRKSRAEAVRANSAFFDQYQQEKAKQFLHFVLNRYEQTGVTELARERLPALIELSGLGTTKDASMAFGGKPAQLLAAFKQLQHQLYHVS